MSRLHGNLGLFIRFISTIAICLVFVLGINQAQNVDARIHFFLAPEFSDRHIDTVEELFHSTQEILDHYGIDVVESFDEDEENLSETLRVTIRPIGEDTNGVEQLGAFTNHDNGRIANLSPILQDNYWLQFISVVHAPKLFAALILYNLDRMDEAEELLLELVPAPSTTSETARFIDYTSLYYFYLGNINLLQGDYETAVMYFSNSGALFPSQALQIATNLAWTHLQLGQSEEAIYAFDDVLIFATVRPQNQRLYLLEAETYSVRAQIYALMFDYDSAIEDINRAIEIVEENYDETDNFYNRRLAELYTIRGEIIFLIYEWDRVEENFTTAIALDSTYAPAYFQRGILFYTVARREDALADFEMYLELDPDGIYAEEAAEYIESIQIEIEALGG